MLPWRVANPGTDATRSRRQRKGNPGNRRPDGGAVVDKVRLEQIRQRSGNTLRRIRHSPAEAPAIVSDQQSGIIRRSAQQAHVDATAIAGTEGMRQGVDDQFACREHQSAPLVGG